MIKAVFIDIDETLTNSQREVTEKTKLEIKKCVENGVKIILTSGRSRREAMDFQEQIGTSPYIVSSMVLLPMMQKMELKFIMRELILNGASINKTFKREWI